MTGTTTSDVLSTKSNATGMPQNAIRLGTQEGLNRHQCLACVRAMMRILPCHASCPRNGIRFLSEAAALQESPTGRLLRASPESRCRIASRVWLSAGSVARTSMVPPSLSSRTHSAPASALAASQTQTYCERRVRIPVTNPTRICINLPPPKIKKGSELQTSP